MATIRAFTTIEQSRKLAEILPLESADMLHCLSFDGDLLATVPKQYSGSFRHQPELTILCWSLTALLNALPNGIVMNKDSQNGRCHFSSTYIDTYVTADNPIDACYDVVLRLHGLKKL